MLSSAIVVFREVFEIVLIVGIVLAATRGIPGRNLPIALGFAGGLAGSALVAYFTDVISEFAEGMGQEFFNAGILFVAAGFIGWTVLWMKAHAREMKTKFMEVGDKIARGDLPYISLSLVIGLAILREGSEIALFSYGMLASGMSFATLLSGAAVGLVGGLIVGGALYFGLIKLSVKYFFQITSWMLVLLVCGMVLQGVGFLSAAGMFSSLSNVVWDSSWLLSEANILGESLKTLVGYTARPTTIQLIAYALTLIFFITLMKRIEKMNKNTSLPAGATAAAIAIVALGGLFLTSSPAYATKKVYTPYVEAGELELEYRGRYEMDEDSDVDGKWVQKAAIGYGVNDVWFTEIYGEWEREGERDADAHFEAVEWENRFQLTNPGEYWADFGVQTEIEYNTSGGPDKVEALALIAKDTGDFSHVLNLGVERQFGEDSNEDLDGVAAWQTRYRYSEKFEPGIEIHSEFGELGSGVSYEDQKHLVGPTAYGKLGHLGYDVGVLFGATQASPDATLKAILEYEWNF